MIRGDGVLVVSLCSARPPRRPGRLLLPYVASRPGPTSPARPGVRRAGARVACLRARPPSYLAAAGAAWTERPPRPRPRTPSPRMLARRRPRRGGSRPDTGTGLHTRTLKKRQHTAPSCASGTRRSRARRSASNSGRETGSGPRPRRARRQLSSGPARLSRAPV